MSSKASDPDRSTGSLFTASELPVPAVAPARQGPEIHRLAGALPATLHLGTSSWHFPGWDGLVWNKRYPAGRLSRDGLAAYAAHPLFRTVSLDRVFYAPLSVDQYASYAASVPDDFRFVIKAPARVTDAWQRDGDGRGRQANPEFLDPETAVASLVEPAVAGLGPHLGAIVYQISPLPAALRDDITAQIDRLGALLDACESLLRAVPGAIQAVEVRDPEWLCAEFVDMLRTVRATYCLGLHPRMPRIEAQLPILRALWPGPLVCRWNLNRRHGAHGYENARSRYAPFDKLVDPDVATRSELARVIASTIDAGQAAYVTINNKAEGSAPHSVHALAEAVQAARTRPTARE